MKCNFPVAFVIACSALVAGESFAADYSLHPFVTVSEEFTDNVYERQYGREADFITRLVPGIATVYKAPFWDWDARYALDYRHYARGKRDDDLTHDLAAHGNVRLIDEFFFLDLDDKYKRVSLDVTRDNTAESLYFNQSDQNILTASPYFLWRPWQQLSFKTGYRYINTWYKSSNGVSKTDHVAFIDGSYELSTKSTVNAGFSYDHQYAETVDYDRYDAYAGSRYEFGEKSYLSGQIGNSWFSYSNGSRVSNVFWNVELAKTFDTVKATLTTGLRFAEDPLGNLSRETFYTAAVEKTLERGSAALYGSFTKYEGNEVDHLNTEIYTLGARGTYQLVPDLTVSATFESDNFVRSYMSNSPRRFFLNSAIAYKLNDTVTLALNYLFVDYYSPTVASDNREVNRVILEMRATF